MKQKKSLSCLFGLALIVGLSWQGFAQEAAAPAAGEVPPQVVSDGGVEATREAQESTPAPAEKMKEARTVLKAQANEKGWREGWDEKKKRAIVIEAADFKTADPATDEAFFVKREMAVKKAVLSAKAAFIQSINQDMSAIDLVNMPGSDVNKALGEEREKLNAELARQKELLANMLEKVNAAEAAELRGTTFGDRLNDLMAAAVKKLDKEYNKNERDEKNRARYNQVKQEFEAAEKRYGELKGKAEAAQEKVREQQFSSVESMAKMPLYGCSVIMQTESWNQSSGKYEVAVLLCWSYAMERSARAIVTGEDFRVKPDENAKSVQDWLESQNLATMIGPRQYLDKDGNRWFLGVTARSYDDELSSSERRKNKGVSEMFAQQMAAFCLWADVESYKLAQSAMESRGNAKLQRDVVAESYAEKLTQSFKDKKVRGMQKLFGGEQTHPITGETIYVVVYGINSSAAKQALEIEKQNYATKIQDNRHQTVERGRDAANRDAVKASENRPEDFQKGHKQQSEAINKEVEQRQQPKSQPAGQKGTAIINKEAAPGAPAKPKKSTSGTFGGDTNVNDNF